ncbi:c-type cytochrome [Psychroflexus montanilacus]|uniref:c-type cytochrome n=1 Tax=Psychroflexus montanilacus TaxID=2873598 RepID=UPI001CCEF829|nr:c-type cytochrome [Psychroflexus montanilacus]MBZ9650781.1 cytochrome c [Psychroflexus montanilacus]
MKFYLIPVIVIFGYLINGFETEATFTYEEILQEKNLQQSISDGEGIYSEFCMRCHLSKGEGVEGIYPPLADSNWLSEKRTESIKSVKYGLKGEIEVNGKTYNNNMTSMGLSDREVADVMNYVMHSFGNEKNDYNQVTLGEVASLSKK